VKIFVLYTSLLILLELILKSYVTVGYGGGDKECMHNFGWWGIILDNIYLGDGEGNSKLWCSDSEDRQLIHTKNPVTIYSHFCHRQNIF
jgi:hypothetical protein